ncbi:MAG: hypothetical protein WCF68_20270 [Terriglobales bacterium]
MTETGARKSSILEGFQVGPVLAAFLIAAGIEALIKVLSRPFAWVIVDAINYFIRVGRLQVVGPEPIDVWSSLIAIIGIPAIVVLLCGLGLGAWLCQGKTTVSTNSQ